MMWRVFGGEGGVEAVILTQSVTHKVLSLCIRINKDKGMRGII